MSGNGLHETHRVSAKLMAGEEAQCVADVVAECHPDAQIHDFGSYLAIEREGELRLDLAAISEALGRPYGLSMLLTILVSFNGAVDVNDEGIVIREAA
tara:strand:- start:1939 stop:2232 length:294 start_codon:yes stop_codon:yes gene_type:complete